MGKDYSKMSNEELVMAKEMAEKEVARNHNMQLAKKVQL
jgi:hypothetical protein